jgi:hypothetical protein
MTVVADPSRAHIAKQNTSNVARKANPKPDLLTQNAMLLFLIIKIIKGANRLSYLAGMVLRRHLFYSPQANRSSVNVFKRGPTE